MVTFAFSDKYIYQLPEGHKFPMAKYQLVHDQLMYEGAIASEQVYDPGLIDEEIILRVHTQAYWGKVKSMTLQPKEQRRIGLPVQAQIAVDRSRNSVAGTYEAANRAMVHGTGVNLAGGTHHAYADRGEGFSMLNDIAITATDLLAKNQIKQALIVDLDVHQGNGNAVIFQGEPRVFTFSMHGQDNYPLRKEKSDLDIGLPTGTGDDTYLPLLETTLERLVNEVKPDMIFYQSGVDVMANDRLGRLGLTKEGCKSRDQIVLRSCKQHNIPVVIVMGGGYSEKLSDLIDAHCNTMRIAIDLFH